MPKISSTFFWTAGILVDPPTRMISSMSDAYVLASSIAFWHGSTVRSIRSATRSSSLLRVSLISKCFGPLGSDVMNGKLMVVS